MGESSRSGKTDPLDDLGVDPDVQGASRRILSKLARRFKDPRELGEDAMLLVSTIVESSDRAKTEAVRMVAREVRTYLEELKLKDDLRELITGHSLEMHLSLSLKPLAEAVAEEEEPEEGDEEASATPEQPPAPPSVPAVKARQPPADSEPGLDED